MAKMQIYGCGGAGMNLAYEFLKYQKKQQETGFAQITPYFIDTSRSNIRQDAPESQIYLFETLDGSGKKRDSNYTAISERSREMLHHFKPGDLNVVIHSASGGSGSVIGPLLTAELLEMRENVVVVVVASSDSRIETDNSIKTLKSYEMISKKKDKAIQVLYYENTPEVSRKVVDANVIRDMMFLCMFFSGHNAELDSADLANFLNYPKVTSWPASLNVLRFITNTNKFVLERGEIACAAATLIDSQTSSVLEPKVEYQAVGFIPDETYQAVKGIDQMTLPFHLVSVGGFFVSAIERLNTALETFTSYRSTVVQKSILSETDHTLANDDGMIL